MNDVLEKLIIVLVIILITIIDLVIHFYIMVLEKII